MAGFEVAIHGRFSRGHRGTVDQIIQFMEWFIVRVTLLILVIIGACALLVPHLKEFFR
jgi:hypothetical protein